MSNQILEQFIFICYSLLTRQPVQPVVPVQPAEELKEAMESFNRMMGLGSSEMPTKDDLSLD